MKKATFAGIALVAFLFTFICFVSPANADPVSFDLSGTFPSASALGSMNFAFTSTGRTAGILTSDNARGFAFGSNGSFVGDADVSPFRMYVFDSWPGISDWTFHGGQDGRGLHFGFLWRWGWIHDRDPFPSPSPTPEPSTLLLLGTGLVCVGVGLRRRSLAS